MAGGISLNPDQTVNAPAKPFALFQPTSPFTPPELRQPPASAAAALLNGATQAQNVQSALQDLANFAPPPAPFAGPAGPLLSSSVGVGVTTLGNPKTPPPLAPPEAPAQIGNVTNPQPPQNPILPPAADSQAAQAVPNIVGSYAANAAALQQVSSQALVATNVSTTAAPAPAPAVAPAAGLAVAQSAPATPAAAAPAPQQSSGTSPLSAQGLAFTQTHHEQVVQSETISDANVAREEQLRADAHSEALQAQLDAARAANAQRQIQLIQQQSSAIQIAAAAASATVSDVAAQASVPGGPAVLTVSDAGGNVLFRRTATDGEVQAARAAADQALREAQAALARLALDQATANQPLGLDPPKGDFRTVDARVTAEFNAVDLNVQLPVPEIPAFVTPGNLPAFDAPILPHHPA